MWLKAAGFENHRHGAIQVFGPVETVGPAGIGAVAGLAVVRFAFIGVGGVKGVGQFVVLGFRDPSQRDFQARDPPQIFPLQIAVQRVVK